MATTKNNGLFTYKDKSGNSHLMYPATKAGLVIGFADKVKTIDPKPHAASHAKDGADPITPKSIGAASESHNHTKDQISDFPNALKNPSALTIQMNGVNAAIYDGSETKTVNITSDGLGMSSEASKVANQITIQLNGGTTENDNQCTFDGSEAKSLDITASKVGAMPTTGGTFSGPVYFGNDSYYINTSGEANFSKAYGAIYNDYAELFPKGEDTRPGDIIALDTDSKEERYVRAVNTSKRVVGVHSDEFAMLIGGERAEAGKSLLESNADKYIPVALAGRVKTWVTGVVHTGDYIVPSEIPGVGRAVRACENANSSCIVGYAVESDDRTDKRRIRIRVKG